MNVPQNASSEGHPTVLEKKINLLSTHTSFEQYGDFVMQGGRGGRGGHKFETTFTFTYRRHSTMLFKIFALVKKKLYIYGRKKPMVGR